MMNAVGQCPTSFHTNPASLFFQLHCRIYRSFNDAIIGHVGSCYEWVVQYELMEYTSLTLQRLANKVSGLFVNQPPFLIESKLRRKKEEETKSQRIKLGAGTYGRFSQAAAIYLDECIPRAVALQLTILPGLGESSLLYKISYATRYANRQLIKKTGYRDLFLSSDFYKVLSVIFNAASLNAGKFFLGKEALSSLVSWESILLQIAASLKNRPLEELKLGKVFRSLTLSLKEQPLIEDFFKTLELSSPEEAFIARLHWHKKHGSLPPGLPDPDKVSLEPANLKAALNEALYDYAEKLILTYLQNIEPDRLKRGFTGVAYYLEGRELLVKALTYLTVEFGYKQLTNPHLFALAVLYSGGIETADLELDGFGFGRREKILAAGQELIILSRDPKAKLISMIAILDKYDLKPSQGGLEEINQKSRAKKMLKEYILSVIYDHFKEPAFRHGGPIKHVRKKISRMPVLGLGAKSLHVLINGMIFSLSYPFRSENQVETTFVDWMAKHFSGKDFYEFLTEKIIEIIYHPSWPVTVLQLVHDVEDGLGKEDIALEDFKFIAEYLFKHVLKESAVPFDAGVAQYCSKFINENALKGFNDKFKTQPNKPSFLEKGLESLIPTIKEITLYGRVLDSFREKYLSFAGDVKFWEIFIRETLNDLTALEIKNDTSKTKREARISLVDQLLEMDISQLHNVLGMPPKGGVVKILWGYLDD